MGIEKKAAEKRIIAKSKTDEFYEFLIPMLEEEMVKRNGPLSEEYQKLKTLKERVDFLQKNMYPK